MLNVKADKVIIILFSILIVFSLNSFFVWSVPGKIVYVFLLLIFLFFFILEINKSKIKNQSLMLSVIFTFISLYLGWTWSSVHIGFMGPLNLALVFCYLILDNSLQIRISRKFIWFFTLILSITLLSWLINVTYGIVGVSIPQPPTKIASDLTYQLSILGEVYPSGLTGLYRYQGIFDEPGVMGTVCALLLCARVFENKIQFALLLLAGLASMSAAFVIIVAVYLFFRKPIITTFSLFPLGAFLVYFTRDIPYLGYFFFTKINNLLFKGESNRVSEGAERLINNHVEEMDTWNFLFGQGYGYVSSHEVDISSWYVILLDSGVLGLLLLFLAFSLCSLIKNNNFFFALPFFMAFLVSFTQRPGVLSLFFVFVYCSAMLMVYPNKKSS